MDVLALLVALLALVVALLAYIRAGGKEEIHWHMEDLGVKAETAREKTADVLDRIEQMVRGKGKPPGEAEAGTADAAGGGEPEAGREGARSRKRTGGSR